MALAFWRRAWGRAYLVMVATLAVDLDHLWATPVYDPERCSIGFHPLHGPVPIALYAALCFVPRARWVRWAGVGLVLHMALDSLDCRLTSGVWFV